MLLKDLLRNIYPHKLDPAWRDFDVSSVECDSRKVEKNGLFIALAGTTHNGAQFVPAAVKKGAKVIVTSEPVPGPSANGDVCYLSVSDAQKFLREVAKNFYGNPSASVKVVGITGTNGKTTATYLLE